MDSTINKLDIINKKKSTEMFDLVISFGLLDSYIVGWLTVNIHYFSSIWLDDFTKTIWIGVSYCHFSKRSSKLVFIRCFFIVFDICGVWDLIMRDTFSNTFKIFNFFGKRKKYKILT